MKPKYIYNVTDQTVDIRNYEIETDKPFTDNDDDGADVASQEDVESE